MSIAKRAPVPIRDKWRTPPELVAAVSKIMQGEPWLDLSASANNAVADAWIGESECDGARVFDLVPDLLENSPARLAWQLAALSRGRLPWAWLNPPYSKGNLPRFTKWASDFAYLGGTVAMLIPHSQSNVYWRKNVTPYARMYLIPDKRVEFLAPDGVTASRQPGHHVVAIMGQRRPWDGETTIKRLVY